MTARRSVGGLFSILRQLDSHPPLDYLLRMPFAGSGSDVLVRLPSVLFSIAALGLFAWWMRDRGRVGLIATALFAVSGFELLYGRQARMYALMELVGVATAVAADHWLRTRCLRTRAARRPEPATTAATAPSATGAVWLVAAATTVGVFTHTSALLLAAGVFWLPGFGSRPGGLGLARRGRAPGRAVGCTLGIDVPPPGERRSRRLDPVHHAAPVRGGGDPATQLPELPGLDRRRPDRRRHRVRRPDRPPAQPGRRGMFRRPRAGRRGARDLLALPAGADADLRVVGAARGRGVPRRRAATPVATGRCRARRRPRGDRAELDRAGHAQHASERYRRARRPGRCGRPPRRRGGGPSGPAAPPFSRTSSPSSTR